MTQLLCWQPGWCKAFSEALIKGQRKPEFCVLSNRQLGKAQSGAEDRVLKELRSQFVETEETQVISPKTAVYSVCGTLEIAYVPFIA